MACPIHVFRHCLAVLDYDCDGGRLAGIVSADAFKAAVSPYYGCPTGLVVPDCAAAAPGMDENGTCLFPGGAALCPGGIAEAAESCAEVAADKHCRTAHPGIRRFCACIPQPTAAPTTSPTAAPTVAVSAAARLSRRRARSADEGAAASAAAGPASPASATTMLLPVLGYLSLGGAGGGKAAVLGGVAMAMLSWAEPADAHNWLMTPSRASRQASTTGPCRGRRNPNDKHAQVGPTAQPPPPTSRLHPVFFPPTLPQSDTMPPWF